MRSKSGYGGLGAMLTMAATLFASGSDRAAGIAPQKGSQVNRGASPALGNEVNSRYSGGGAALGQKKRRKLARQTTRPSRGVRCQGSRPGSGRRSR